MRHILVWIAVILPLILATPLAHSASGQDLDLEAERAALLETDRAMAAAYTTSDAPLEVIFATFADDLRILAPDVPMVEGAEGAKAMWNQLSSLPGYSLRFTPVYAEVGGAADLGYTIGTYHMTVPNADGEVVAIDGKYLTVWRRDADGVWKMAVDMFNSDGPPVPVSD